MNIENLPQSFEFYHLGPVTNNRIIDVQASDLVQEHRFFAFEKRSDELVDILIIGIPTNKNISKYTELGNILASRTYGPGISAPREITKPTLKLLESASLTKYGFEYIHTEAGTPTLLPVFLLTCIEMEPGNV